jgi:AcrR family transcriptional regulator
MKAPSPRDRHAAAQSREDASRNREVATKQMLVETTLRMIASSDRESRSHINLRLVDVLAQTGVSRARFYELFDSKDDLLRAVRTIGAGHFARELERGMHGRPPLAQIACWVVNFLQQSSDVAIAKRHRFFVLDEFRLLADEKDVRVHFRQNFTAAVGRAITEAAAWGDLPRGIDVPRAEASVWYVTSFAFFENVALLRPPHAEDIRFTAEFVLRGLGATAEGIATAVGDLSF